MFSAKLSRLTIPNLKLYTKHFGKKYSLKYQPYANVLINNDNPKINELIKKCASRLIYNSIIEKDRLLMFKNRKKTTKILKTKKLNAHVTINEQNVTPIALKYLSDDIKVDEQEILNKTLVIEKEHVANFPYDSKAHIEKVNDGTECENSKENSETDLASKLDEEVRKRNELSKEINNWMTAYDNYDDTVLEDENLDVGEWKINYGTPDPKVPMSDIPCGGCGALLHCKVGKVYEPNIIQISLES